MRLRVLVVAAFLAMSAVPVYLAWEAGLVPGPTQAAADSSGTGATAPVAVAPLVWPEAPLGLAGGRHGVYWVQRDRSAAVAGLWYYAVRDGKTRHLLGRASAGRPAGHPSASGKLLVWASRAGVSRAGGQAADRPSVQALDVVSGRRWQAAEAGRAPKAAGDVVLWVDSDGAGHGEDAIRGANALTDEVYALRTGGRVKDYSVWRTTAVWISGPDGAVWTGSLRGGARQQLAKRGTAVTIDGDRVVWTASAGKSSTAVVSWDRSTRGATALARLPGAASALSVSRGLAVWVLDREASGPRVWACDLAAGYVFAVDPAGGRQVSPVIVAGRVFWAGDRTGRWELYSRALRR